jgi:membrane-bound lytic murein transglycosylase A
MNKILSLIIVFLLFLGCSNNSVTPPKENNKEKIKKDTKLKKIKLDLPKQNVEIPFCETPDNNKSVVIKPRIIFKNLPKTYLVESSFDSLPNWHKENYDEALDNFLNSCKTKKTQKIYKNLCKKATYAIDSKKFIQEQFLPYKINTKSGKEEGLLTGYYEPELKGSRVKTKKYKYPIYKTPADLIIVDLSSIYPHLKNYRLRGKVVGNRLVPYETRKQSHSKHLKSEIICYTDSKIDLFFLEIQGSGRVTLDNGETIFIGYDNQNGHKYRAIGRYLVKIGAMKLKDVSLQSIRAWLIKHPSRVDEVLNYNKSVVYFKERKKPAAGSLGLCLTPERSIAVDRRYIPLGTMLYLNADLKDKKISKIVLAQDTGGAIKGAIRADMFLGYGKDAKEIAGRLKSPLKLWILLPKKLKTKKI